MVQEDANPTSPRPKRLLKDQVRLVKRRDCNRYEIVPIQEPLSFEKGFFAVIRACQLLAQKNNGIILVGVAGPSGAGKTVFTEKILNFMPSIAVISLDNYNDGSRIVDGNYDGNIFYLIFFQYDIAWNREGQTNFSKCIIGEFFQTWMPCTCARACSLKGPSPLKSIIAIF